MKSITIGFWLLVCSLNANAIDKDSTRKNFIGFRTLKSITNEIGLLYQHKIQSDKFLGLYVAYIYPNHFYDFFTVLLLGSPVLFYRGISLSATIKKPLIKDNIYKGLQINFKYQSFENQELWYGGLAGSYFAYSDWLSRYKTTIGIQYLLGIMPTPKILDVHIGGGFQLIIINENLLYRELSWGYIDKNFKHKSRKILPLPSLSLVMFFGGSW